MKEQDQIIVLRTFAGNIEASLAKSKLDAHGIPCFLTEESLAGLFPVQNPGLSVRLHVFKQDADQARALLDDEHTF